MIPRIWFVLFSILVFPVIPFPAEARLDATLEKCQQLYGSEGSKKEGGEVIFFKEEFAYICFFENKGKCDQMVVLKPDPETGKKLEFTGNDVMGVLDKNSATEELGWEPGGKAEDATILINKGGEREAHVYNHKMQVTLMTAAGLRRLGGKPKVPDTKGQPGPPRVEEKPDGSKNVIQDFGPEEGKLLQAAFAAKEAGDYEKAAELLMTTYQAVRKNEKTAEDANQLFGPMFFELGECYRFSKNPALAAFSYERFVNLYAESEIDFGRKMLVATSHLVRILSASPDPKIRNPEKAVGYVKNLEAAGGMRVPGTMDTIATAHAAVGNYKDAIAIIDKIDMSAIPPAHAKVFLRHRAQFAAGKSVIHGEEP